MRINPSAAAAMLDQRVELAKRNAFADMIKPAIPARGVLPTGEQPMAMDATLAMDDAWSQFAQTPYSGQMGMGAESLVWLGYPFLAELSQRAEYRMMCETIAKEMTRRWIELESTGDKSAAGSKTDKMKRITDVLEHHKAREKFRRAAELDAFFGRGQIYIDTGYSDEKGELITPLLLHKSKINKKAKLKYLKVIEPFWTYPGDYNSTNPLHRDFYLPRSWYVMGTKLHASRMLTFVSREMPDMLKPAYSFGGMSLSQLAQPYVNNWLRTRQSVSDLLHSFSVSGLKTNMAMTLGDEDGDATDLAKRAQLFNITRDNRGLLMLDKDSEEFFNVSTPLGTLDHLQAQAQEQMASVSHIPLVILLGITPSGLNASSDGEIRVFYAWIKSMQEHLFSDPLRKLIDMIQLGEFGEIDPEISFKYVPLWDESEKDRAEVKKTQADTDAVYVGLGSIGPDEVRKRIAEDPDLPYQDLDLSEPAPGEQPGFGEDPNDMGEAPGSGQPPRLGNGLAAPGGAQPSNSTVGPAAIKQAKAAMGSGGEDRQRPFGLAHDEDSKPVHRYQFDGIRVGIETRKGDVREGRTWQTEMPADYGYIMRTEGADGDRMDCLVGPYRPEQLAVFIVDQHRIDATGAFDEHKVLLGFQTITDAIAAYDACYADGSGPARRRRVWQMSWDQLRPWLLEVKHTYALDAEFNEAEHPRGQPENAGEFAPTSGGGSKAAKPTAKAKNTSSFALEGKIKQSQTLTPAQQKAAEYYRSKNKVRNKEMGADLSAAIAANQTIVPMILHRGIAADYDTVQTIENSVGKEIAIGKAFTSATEDADTASMFAQMSLQDADPDEGLEYSVVFQISVPSGANALPMTDQANEAVPELILDPKCRYKLIKLEDDGQGNNVAHVSMIHDGTKSLSID